MYEAQRKTLRRAERLIRKLDRFADGKLVEDGVPAQEIALELSQIANDLVVLEAIERVRPLAFECNVDESAGMAEVVDIGTYYGKRAPCS